MHWWARLRMQVRYLRSVEHRLDDHAERVQRLEIAARRLSTAQDELGSDYQHLEKRINAIGGRLGGRQRAGVRSPGVQGELTLDAIPRGDKEGLRAYFKLHPPKRDTDQEEG